MHPDSTIGNTHIGVHIMSVVNFRTQKVPKDFASLQSKIEKYQRVGRQWAGHISGNEMAMVEVLIDRTVGWGRREAYFTIRSLLAGDAIYSGLTMSRRTAFRVLKSLENKGLIQRRHDKNIPDRVHFTVNMDWKPDAENVSKRLNGRCHDDTTRCHDDTDQCHNGTLYTGNNLQVSNTGSQAGAPAPLPLPASEIIRAKAGAAAAANRATLKAKAEKPQAAVDAVDAAWRLALIDTFPGTAYRTWGVREKAQIRQVLRNWRGNCTLPEFVTWAVTNWTAIMRKQFRWMTKNPPPATPALSFFIAFLQNFAEARADNVLEDWLTSEDRTALERMMGRGQTYEQATAELAKDKMAVALRGEIRKGKIEARARDLAATRKLAEARHLAELKGGIPIHPKSPAAQRLIEEERRASVASTQLKATKLIAPNGEMLQGAEVYFVDPERNPFDD